jgi:hypothetical protein
LTNRAHPSSPGISPTRKLLLVAVVLGLVLPYVNTATASVVLCTTSKILGNNLAIGQDGPGVVVDSHGMYLTYTSPTSVKIAYSQDGGATFASSVAVKADLTSDVRLSISERHLYLTWIQVISNIHYLMEATNTTGRRFGSPAVVGVSNGNIGHEAAAVGSNLYIAFIGPSKVITLAVSHDFGASFALSKVSNSSFQSQEISLAAFKSSLYMVWESATPRSNTMEFLWSNDNGSTYSLTQLQSTKESREPILTVSQSGAIYLDYRGPPTAGGKSDIFLMKGKDGGTTFSLPRDISRDIGNSREPWVSADGSNVYLSWRDTTNSSTSFYNVFVAVSNNRGSSFFVKQISNETGVTNVNKGNGYFSPEVSSSNGKVAVLWDAALGGTQQEFISLSVNAGQGFTPVHLDTSAFEGNQLLTSANGTFYAVWEASNGIGVAVCG